MISKPFATIVSCIAIAGSALAQDSSLPPVKDNLVLWIDAAAQATARQSASLPPLRPFQGADLLIDGSESGRNFVQPLPDKRPILITTNNAAFLRFDGEDDFLFSAGKRPLTAEFTLFVLAAPKSNPGGFRALFATSDAGGNDYTNGLNIDFGFQPTERLSVVNVESAGAGGMGDLLMPGLLNADERPFGDFHLFTVRSRIAKEGTEFFLDGIKGGARDRLESMIGLDRMVLGGRFYSNEAGVAPYAQGFFKGDIAAVAAYERRLEDDEISRITDHLLNRVAPLTALASGNQGHALEIVPDAPVVQMLVPGFSVEEVPLKLGNLTSIRYRHDGKLVALGYDGTIHLAEDSNGDGTPDKSVIWWEKGSLQAPIGLALLPAGDPRGEGAFVASKGKFSLILDRDRDGRADEEIVVASGWPGTFHGVDALGSAIDPSDGSVYFSIGCANFAAPYQIDPSGVSRYDIGSLRGTVQRVTPDLKSTQTVATGVRFLCALAFNKEGDLFATDQEGATWLPNGNPFDELLHIEPGKHYGFPPRHPRHLPEVLDEPAVFEYGPQHQSTCGMVFNEGVNGGSAFGPPHWQGDAIVCGQSRGKLWRTKLAKTPEGYVAQSHLFACLNLLTIDACVTPAADLLVACHSGPPDWGTGPAGEGSLFLIRWKQPETPQPVMAWASSPDEFRIAFDKPMQTQDWAGALEKVRIEAGAFAGTGDRFETVRPGYQVVRDQMASPRRWIDPQSLLLSADNRTLVLRVPPQTEPVTYAITLPKPETWETNSPLPQSPEIDVALSLHGIEATTNDGARIVLPHPSLEASRTLTKGSAEHEKFFASNPENVTFQARVDLSNIFQPATQPGSQLDWDISEDAFAQRLMTLHDTGSDTEIMPSSVNDAHIGDISHTINSNSRLAFRLDAQVRPISPQRVFLPWMRHASTPGIVAESGPRTDVDGNWLHGRRLYFGKTACSTCHTIRGEGVPFGPDLSNLIHRDRESVLEDILKPSATINPDHAGSQITLKNGGVIAGIIAESTPENIILLLPGGGRSEWARQDIAMIEPMKISLMPEGFGQALSDADKEDLLTFLLTEPIAPARITRSDPGPPPARSLKEVEPFLAPPPLKEQPLRILLSASAKDHGLDEHDYPLWLERWSTLLALADGVTVHTCMGFPTAEQLANADVTVLYSSNAGWDLRAAKRLADYQERGGGLVYLHWSIEGHKNARELADAVGLAFSMSAFRHGEMNLVFGPDKHPITGGFEAPIRFIDESYWKLHGDRSRISILAQSMEDNQARPQLWVKEKDKARVFGCIPGHYTWTFDDPLYRILVLRGICWAAHLENLDYLNELALIGARITD